MNIFGLGKIDIGYKVSFGLLTKEDLIEKECPHCNYTQWYIKKGNNKCSNCNNSIK